jgi:iron complex transport system permease protein
MDQSSTIAIRFREATAALILCLSIALVGVIMVSAGMGYIKIPLEAIVKIIATKISGKLSFIEGLDQIFPVVVFDVRLPRILTAALVGGGLAMSGVVFQGILLNPLADPYTLGVSAGAAFGASLAILLNIHLLGTYSIFLPRRKVCLQTI